ncbi:MAG TPA: hypothetical protein EYN91_25405 [Candidatus Melainabacteria bacterium]|jgi:Mn-containing catalase|nr:hypothetical protein [Candidatus Melainabacteria bacterium]HIN66566.1 hypothetical protein [Candidatus Obscuribacterales bacterium]
MNPADQTTAEERELQRLERVQCKRLYELSEHPQFGELLEFLKQEEKAIISFPQGGLNGMIDYMTAKVWQDAVIHIQNLLTQKINAGKQISGKEDDELKPGDITHGQEGYWRTEPQQRRRA